MSASLEVHFQCDRCGVEQWMPAQNTPVAERMPAGWRAVAWPGDNIGHLCARCSTAFDGFMAKPPT